MRVAQQLRVLLIEDDTLECHGLQVVHAVNGLTGLLAKPISSTVLPGALDEVFAVAPALC